MSENIICPIKIDMVHILEEKPVLYTHLIFTFFKKRSKSEDSSDKTVDECAKYVFDRQRAEQIENFLMSVAFGSCD